MAPDRRFNTGFSQGISNPGEDGEFDVAEIASELGKTLLIALLVALLVRTLLVETYLVYGPSMEPSLHEGERLLVNKVAYLFAEPSRGDVIIFNDAGENGRNLIKRVVAAPGDRFEIRRGNLFVDGQLVRESYVICPSHDTHPPQRIPAGQVFVMGDNRANSLDSRYFGPVSTSQIRGKAFIVFWPLSRFHLLTDGRLGLFQALTSPPSLLHR